MGPHRKPASPAAERGELEIRALRADETPQLVACVRRCYGETYIDPGQYDADVIARAIRDGRRHSVVAVTADGTVVGHMGLTLRRIDDNTADAGMTLVDPEHRGRGLSRALGMALGRRGVELGLVGAHDYPVTVHGATQHIGADHFVETGILLDNLPADVRFRGMDDERAGEASASVIRYLPLGAQPVRDVFAPPAYAALLEGLYARIGLVRRPAAAAPSPAPIRSELEVHDDRRRGVLRVTAPQVGASIGSELEALRRAAGPPAHAAVQIDLRLADPGAPAGVAALRSRGFFFGGLLPEYREGDVLRLQRLPAPPDPRRAPILESDAGRLLCDFVLHDAATVSAAARGEVS